MSEKEKTVTIPVYSAQGKEIDRIKLDKKPVVNEKLLARAVIMYQANKRRGTADTKTRTEVTGSGKKPWKQKGTGRARVRDIRNPIWRKGGIVFGPHPRDHHYALPKKMLTGALVSGVNSKLRDGKLLIIEDITVKEPKTREIKGILDKLKIKDRTLFVAARPADAVKKSCRNIRNLMLKNASDFNALDVLKNDNLLFTKAAFDEFQKRFA